MGRGRGKGKRFSMTSHEDGGSGEEEKIPVQKRRGRPQKPLKDEEIDEEEYDKIEENESEITKNGVASNKESKSSIAVENGKKRKRTSQGKEKSDLVKVENSFGNDSIKPKGFRHDGSRRKSKPRRAAEAGVKCN